MENPLHLIWRNSAWFTAHPEKVCGKPEMRSTRFDGHQLFTIGTMADVKRVLHFDVMPSVQPWHPATGVIAVPPKQETATAISTALRKTKAAKEEKRHISPGQEPELLPFDEVMHRYSPKMSDEDLRLYVQYMLGRGFDKAVVSKPDNGWSRYTTPLPKSELLKMCESGHAGFDGKEWVPGGLFYSGAVYLKVLELSEKERTIVAEIGKELHEAQLKRMEAAAPEKLRIVAPESERLFISPISSFAERHSIQDLIDESLDEPRKLKDVYWSWLGGISGKMFRNGSNASDVRNHFLEHKNFEKDTDEAEKATRSRKAHEDGIALFHTFLSEAIAPREQSVIEHVWNSEYNGWVETPSYGVPTAFPINTRFNQGPIDPRPALWEGVRFIRAQKSGIVAFDVGVGKTMTAILCMADALYTGGCKRPLIVVPNPTYEKWITETVGRYDELGNEVSAGVLPHYRDKINDWFNLGKGYGHLPKEGAPKDGTITFMSYEGLLNMSMSEKEIGKTLDMIIEKLDNGSTGRNAAEANQAVRTKYFGKLVSKAVCNFDEMGFDMLIIDEAHRCKNLFEAVKEKQTEEGKRDSKKYDMSGSSSTTALKAFAFSNYVQRNNGNRNTIYLTATPFTNSPLEIYSMLAQVGMAKLDERNMGNAPAFFDSFVDETTELAVKPTGGIEEKTVVKRFQNRVVLQSFIYSSILFKTGEEANVPRPTKIVLPYMRNAQGVPLPLDKQVLTFLPPSELQQKWLAAITLFAGEKKPKGTLIGSMIPSEYYDDHGMLPGQALMAISMAQAVTLSPYLLNVSTGKEPEKLNADGSKKPSKRTGTRFLIEERPTPTQYVETSPKLTYVMECIRSVKKWHESRGESVSGQVIYMNSGADFFGHLKQYLVDVVGYAANEVAIIGGGMDQDEKERIKEQFNGGIVKIIIGSSSIREGIDLQKRSTVLYNCVLDWNPTDIVQLEGRIWRQNNRYSHVRIVVPLIENSIDPFLFQLLEEKTARINDIWARANRSNVLNVDKFDPAELKRGLMTNPVSIAKVIRDEALNKLTPELAVASGFLEDLQSATITIKGYHANMEWLRGTMARSIAIMGKLISDEKTDLSLETAQSKHEAIEKRITRYETLISDHKADHADTKAMYRLLKAANNAVIAEGYWTFREVSDGLQPYKAQGEIRTLDEMIKQEKSLDSVQKGILARAGMSLSDDLQPLIDEYATEVGRIEAEVTRVKSKEYLEEEERKATQELNERASRSQSLPVRVAQFETMNHLLGCLMDVNDCSVDSAVTSKVVSMDTDAKAKKLKMAKAYAYAAQARIRILQLMKDELLEIAA